MIFKSSRQIVQESLDENRNSYPYAVGCLQARYDHLLDAYRLLERQLGKDRREGEVGAADHE